MNAVLNGIAPVLRAAEMDSDPKRPIAHHQGQINASDLPKLSVHQ